jgi:hypothetical protein
MYYTLLHVCILVLNNLQLTTMCYYNQYRPLSNVYHFFSFKFLFRATSLHIDLHIPIHNVI